MVLEAIADGRVPAGALVACIALLVLSGCADTGAGVRHTGPANGPAPAERAVVPAAWDGTSPVETEVTIRVLSRDAMFIGPSMGARVSVRDTGTGELLASGITIGGTGARARIMDTPRSRGDRLASDETAVYRTTLTLSEPTRIEVTAEAPISNPVAMNRVSSTQWVVPGRHLTGGDGWVLELPGFSVEILAPVDGAAVQSGDDGLELRAKVVLMCGCPTEPGGTWDARGYEIGALLYRGDAPVARMQMQFAGEESLYRAVAPAQPAGAYRALVFAYDPATGNTGAAEARFEVQ